MKEIQLKMWAIALLLLPTLAFSQDRDPVYPVVNGKMHYEKVVQVDSATAVELYDRCKVWVGKTFVSAKNVIQSDTKDELVLNGNFSVLLTNWAGATEHFCEFRLSIAFKEGRYKYVVDNVKLVMTPYVMEVENFIKDEKVWKKNGETRMGNNLKYRTIIVEKMNGLLALLEASMTSKKTSDW